MILNIKSMVHNHVGYTAYEYIKTEEYCRPTSLRNKLVTSPGFVLKDKYPNFEVGLKCIIMVF